EAMEQLAKAVFEDHGVVDVLVNNAGIGLAGAFLDTTVEDWRRVLDVNLWGVIHGCRLFGRQMVERGQGGHIVNVASAAGIQPSKGLPAYSTSKAAVLMLSECLRADSAGAGIGVSAIRPRRVKFDWEHTPLHWIPDDPATTHLINVLHLLLPAGEKWFVDVYRDALPLITDDQLREAVKGFMGQESVHSRAHAAVLDH